MPSSVPTENIGYYAFAVPLVELLLPLSAALMLLALYYVVPIQINITPPVSATSGKVLLVLSCWM